jgi:hypothetical protein
MITPFPGTATHTHPVTHYTTAEVLTVVNIKAMFVYNVLLFCVGEAKFPSLLFCPEDGSSMLVQNVATGILNYIKSPKIRLHSFFICLFQNGQRISGQERSIYLHPISIMLQSVYVHTSLPVRFSLRH